MSDWITTRGEVPDGDTNFTPEAQRGFGNNIVGTGGMETRTGPDGNSYIVKTENQEYTQGADLGYQGSVIGSARTEGGGVIVDRAAKGADRITLPNGMTTSINAAVLAGFLTRNSDGSFSDIQTSETLKNPAKEVPFGQPQVDAKETPEAASSFSIGNEGEEALAAIVGIAPQGDIVRATDEILQLGAVSENTLIRMASNAGVEPEALAAQIEATHQGYYETATAHLADHGVVNEEAFQAYLNDNPRQVEELLKASRSMLSSRGANATDGLTDVATAFVENGDKYMPQDVKDALDEVGFDYSTGADGRILVEFDGMPVPWNVAVRQGLIKFL